MKIFKKVLTGAVIVSCLLFGLYQYETTISTLKNNVALLELQDVALSHRLEQSESSLQKIASSFAQKWMKTLVRIEDINKGYSFIETNGGIMTIRCKQEPNKNNSYVGTFLIGNPNNFMVKELTISMSFFKEKDSEIETKKYFITKDLYPGSWTEISIRADELSSISQSKNLGSPIIELSINHVEFKGEVEKMTKVIELMKLSKSI